MTLKILVIDDEQSIRKTFKLRLAKWGYQVLTASSGDSGIQKLRDYKCQVVITDLKMPGLSGQEVLGEVKKRYPDIEVVMITGYATIEAAVETMKAGAFDFLVKPLNFEHVRLLLKKIEKNLKLKAENEQLKDRINILSKELTKKYRVHNLVGKSPSMQRVFELIERVAPLNSTVLIYGETGTGKEMVARAIHHNGPRSSGPIITVDCGSLTETLLESELFGHEKGAFTGAMTTKKGKFEQAHNGTIFLDEIANASQVVQKKLLRLIQEKTFQRVGGEISIKVDVRIIAAANEDLFNLVKQGKFRQDLFYRLNVVPVHLPPLRDRKEDILLLTRYFIDQHSRQIDREPMEIKPEALKELLTYPWPGNVRELSNVVERTIIMNSGQSIKNFLISEAQPSENKEYQAVTSLDPPLKEQMSMLERNYIKSALEYYNGRIKKVIKRSGLNSRTLFRKMKLYDLDKKEFR